MTDRKVLHDPTETPEDVATLYSWANLHGAKYRDFSAARAQTREKARLRVEQAIEEERRLNRQEAAEMIPPQAQSSAGEAAAEDAAHQAQLAAELEARHAAE